MNDDGGFVHSHFMTWFHLHSAAAGDDWAGVRKTLAASPAQLPRHSLTTPVMVRAVAAGADDVVDALLARGYEPERQDIADILALVADDASPAAGACLGRLLSRLPQLDTVPFIRAAIKGRAAKRILPVLQAAGADLTLDGAALGHALAAESPEGLEALLSLGVYSPFAPAVVAAIGATDRADMKAAYEEVMASAPENSLVDKFRAAAAAGQPVRAALFLNPHGYDDSGAAVTLLGVMAARGLLGEVFAAAVWRHHPDDVIAVHKALGPYGLAEKVSLADVAAELRRQDLQTRGRGKSLRIKPR